ncbi:hypothetical protein OBBRIDRAFT_530182 [Obba rivulosa]|uniref:Uncharacterized protein n=1 Tax=Obba rivulosa TaxID=1052685 RepID=A0A8E2DKD2_9APHY|nr:hypothetical protein OBBRIDRAFT_530182 [Obba rivulosa]
MSRDRATRPRSVNRPSSPCEPGPQVPDLLCSLTQLHRSMTELRRNRPAGWYQWVWRPRNSLDLHGWDVPRAVQALIELQLDLVVAETGQENYFNWQIEDLESMSTETQVQRKKRLCTKRPGLVTGRVGDTKGPQWLPVVIMCAIVPRAALVSTRRDSDLVLCNIVWRNPEGALGITLYNNHQYYYMDHENPEKSLRFAVAASAPLVQGSRDSNRNFSAAAQYLYELVSGRAEIDLKYTSEEDVKGHDKIHIRAGDWISYFQWYIGEASPVHRMTLVMKELPLWSLMAVTQDKDNGHPNEGEVKEMYERHIHEHMSIPAAGLSNCLITEEAHQLRRAGHHEFVFTVLDLPHTLKPRDLFSGIYDIFPAHHSWHVANPNNPVSSFDFYWPDPGHKAHMYCRYRRLHHGPPVHLVGINYLGLPPFLATGPASVAKIPDAYENYKAALSQAVHRAFQTMPDLAIHLAEDIIGDDGFTDGTIGRVLRPPDAESGDAYRAAFVAAWGKHNPRLGAAKSLFPFVVMEEESIIQHFGMVPVRVEPHVREILRCSGAFSSMRQHIRPVLLQAPEVPDAHTIPGYDLFVRAMKLLLHEDSMDREVSVRQSMRPIPRALWDKQGLRVVIRVPDACKNHPNCACDCWVGPYLEDLAEDIFTHNNDPSEMVPNDVPLPFPRGAAFRAYREAILIKAPGVEHGLLDSTLRDDRARSLSYVMPSPNIITLGHSRNLGSAVAASSPHAHSTPVPAQPLDASRPMDEESSASNGIPSHTSLQDFKTMPELMECFTSLVVKLNERDQTSFSKQMTAAIMAENLALKEQLERQALDATVRASEIRAKDHALREMIARLHAQQKHLEGLEAAHKLETAASGEYRVVLARFSSLLGLLGGCRGLSRPAKPQKRLKATRKASK